MLLSRPDNHFRISIEVVVPLVFTTEDITAKRASVFEFMEDCLSILSFHKGCQQYTAFDTNIYIN